MECIIIVGDLKKKMYDKSTTYQKIKKGESNVWGSPKFWPMMEEVVVLNIFHCESNFTNATPRYIATNENEVATKILNGPR